MFANDFFERIKKAQEEALKHDPKQERIKGQLQHLSKDSRGLMVRYGRIWIPSSCTLKETLFDETHKSKSVNKKCLILPIRESSSSEVLADLFVKEVVARHGIPVSIVSDRDTRFTSHFWRMFHEDMGTKLHFSTTYHPQTDGQSERTIQTLEDMLRACIIDFGGPWDAYLPLAEFSYNNSYHSSIKMPPYEMLYGYVKGISMEGFATISQTWKVESTVHSPFRIVARIGKMAYQLELPEELSRIHNTFHVSQIRKCLVDDATCVPLNEIELHKKLTYVEEPVAIVEEELGRINNKTVHTFKVRWKHHKSSEYTWETEHDMLVYYPSLHMAWITGT
uniref:uncharacterized protein LOC122597070 n=1 Tax=Erigeron canadensis TaxID=72917 RepID=UPI001CB8E4F3|nr:uncharacterized protein LOC122597070 [Erigeron canadensis]